MTAPSEKNNGRVVLSFFLIPTIMLIFGYVLFPYPPSLLARQLSFIPLFLGLILLGAGFFFKGKNTASMLKIVGWGMVAFFWATMPSFLYFSEGGDVFNAAVCIIGVYVLMYMAYHEWLSIIRNDHVSCLNWIAGGTFLAGIIYFTIENGIVPGLKDWLIEFVAAQSTDLLHLFGVNASRNQTLIIYNNTPVTIIFACTAIQSMVLFVGMIGALSRVNMKRKALGLLVTVVPIYFLNLVRNAGVVFMVGSGMVSFELAHNVIGKAGSLLALIVLLFVTFKIVPELYDEIVGIIDLPKRRGPVELFIGRLLGKKHDAHR
ncbi:MAG: archaeosortase A [Thermoplasmata archaeon]|nr:archaeosortase A [Thermoplasmata archaeon]MBE3137169.1 archaeosortase A [Thermoplasmata archaeon]MBE3140514.1 archaeosortase A [Thermoplasmata archaeon]